MNFRIHSRMIGYADPRLTCCEPANDDAKGCRTYKSCITLIPDKAELEDDYYVSKDLFQQRKSEQNLPIEGIKRDSAGFGTCLTRRAG